MLLLLLLITDNNVDTFISCSSIFFLVSQQVKKSEAVGLVCLAALLVAIYMIWLLLTIRYHCQVGLWSITF